MFVTQVQFSERWRVDMGNFECRSRFLYLKSQTDGEPKARHAECLPDIPVVPVEPIGNPTHYDAYRKVRIGDAVIEVGLWFQKGDVIAGNLQVDRIAPGTAIKANLLNFEVSVADFDELLNALLQAKLVRVDSKIVGKFASDQYRERCDVWDGRAQGATDVAVWPGANSIQKPRPKKRDDRVRQRGPHPG